MDIEITDLYSDSVWCDQDALISAEKKIALLDSAKDFYENLGIGGAECGVEITTPASYFQTKIENWAKPKNSKLNKALRVNVDFDPFTLSCIFTISTFDSYSCLGVYKLFSNEAGDAMFVINHSAEARRRTLLGKLKGVEAMDRFYLVDQSFDRLTDFLSNELKSLAKKSLPGPE